ncbi:MAG TPA: elongation factor P maturation arginine rhamnosyltransferase EarP, partial [Orrella sp.]
MRALSADLFCRVIDNLGDIGVMWRLARQLHDEKGWQVRLWVDDLKSLGTIEPTIDRDKPQQVCQHVDVRRWLTSDPPIEPNPIVIAGFSCDLPPEYLKALAQQPTTLWLQLEYLSAQDWVASFHGLSSLRNDGLKPV